MIKRISTCFIVLMLLISQASAALAAQAERTSPAVYHHDELIGADTFVDENGRTQVNADFFAEFFDLQYRLDRAPIDANGDITSGAPARISFYDYLHLNTDSAREAVPIMSFTEGDFRMIHNGEEIATDTAARFTDSGVYVPLRYAAEALGKAVAWDSETGSVYLDEPLSNEARRGISRIVVTDSCIWYGSYETVLDFEKCQMTVAGTDSWLDTDTFHSTYIPSEQQAAFFDAVEKNEMLRWSDDDWPWYGPGMYMDITDQIYYTVTIAFDDGATMKCDGYTMFPQNWNEMRSAFRELTGRNVLPDKAPELFPDEALNIIDIDIQCATETEDRYQWDSTMERLSHSFLGINTERYEWQSYYPNRETQLALFDAIRRNEVMRWGDPDWEWRPSTPNDDTYECKISITYFSYTPLMGEYGGYPIYYYDLKLTIGGEAGYPKNWEEMRAAFLDILGSLEAQAE